MRLYEYQAKRILQRHGVLVPRGAVAHTPSEAREVAGQLGERVVVKAQVLATERGRAGGIRLVNGPDEAELAAQEMLSLDIRGMPVRKLLVERAVDIAGVLYIGLAAASDGQVVATIAGESAPFSGSPYIIQVDPSAGLWPFQVREAAYSIALSPRSSESLVEMSMALWQTMLAVDALRIEINPVAVLPTGELIAIDAEVTIDDNALYRQPEIAELAGGEEASPQENDARRQGMHYVPLGGNIGTLVNGAGLAMATADVIALLGGRPANIMDIGGAARARRVAMGMHILLSDDTLRAILINIVGGITRCDEVAGGILAAICEEEPHCPLFARLSGTSAELGQEMLRDSSVTLVPDLLEGARMAVAAAAEEQA